MSNDDIQALVKADIKTLNAEQQRAVAQYLQLLEEQDDQQMGRPQAVDIKILKDSSPPKFELPGETLAKELDAIVIASMINRALWPSDENYSGPPLCGSVGGQVGMPNLDLIEEHLDGPALSYLQTPDPFCGFKAGEGPCPLNKWGSDFKGGRGCACSDQRDLLLIIESYNVAMRLRTPPTSSKNWDKYLQEMKVVKRAVFAMKTKITLESVSRTQNEKYAIIHFAAGDNLPLEDLGKIIEWREQWKDTLGQMKFVEEQHLGDEPINTKPQGEEITQPETTTNNDDDDDEELPF